MSAERGNLEVADLLGVAAAGLGELPRDTAHFDDRYARGVGQGHRHLQDDFELVANGIGASDVKRLCAVASLQQESFALGDIGEEVLEVTRFTGKNQWWFCP